MIAICSAAMASWMAPAAEAGTTVADSGFRPTVDGFSFKNYGSGHSDLGPGQVRTLFGPDVCARVAEGRCVLSPVARDWMEAENEGGEGGHCSGFSVLSLLLFSHQWPPFGLEPTYGLRLADNEELERTIAYAAAFQVLPSVQAKIVRGTPNEILEFLRTHLRPGETETWTMGITRRGDEPDGHAITPYAVENEGGGLFDLLVYDNNWPGEERRVHFDTNANTWRYFAAQNPTKTNALYDGDAKTQSTFLLPTTPGLGVQPCWFCLNKADERVHYNEVRLVGYEPDDHAHLLLTDSRGRRTGFVGGRLVNKIPGAKVISQVSGGRKPKRLWDDTQEPIYHIPRDLDFKVTVDGSTLEQTDGEGLVVLGPGYDAGINQLLIDPGERAQIDLSNSGNAVTYRHNKRTESADATLGVDGRESDLRLHAVVEKAPEGTELELRNRRDDQEMVVRDSASEPLEYRIRLVELTDKLTWVARGALKMAGSETAVVNYRHLNDDGSVIVTIRNPDGAERTLVLPGKADRD